ncbi:hypothetical protein ACJJTC_010264 [Scirpophaga incertulas]
MLFKCRIILLVVFFGATFCSEEQTERLVRTPQGPVKGYKEDGIFVFYGIPYATVPKGKYKFSAPYPAPAWLQPLDAVEKGIICPQGFTFPNKTMQEDCLIANVFVPDTDKKKLPVVVYVHGGAYQVGYSNLATPIHLVKSEKLIAVTFNYRLGIHGFLCLGTNDVPGNAGMKDQVALLKWVQKNIASYGGNPEDVTIAGYSAGSSSVDLLMLSPLTRDLFSRVIPESGANLAAFSVQIDPLENAKVHAKSLGFDDVENIYALEQFYKTASFDILIADTFMNRTDSVFIFSPCVERKIGAENFLTDSPYNILKSGKYRKLPILYGFANMEGMLRLPFYETWKHKMNENFADFLPVDLQFVSEEEKNGVIEKIKKFYFNGQAVGDDNILSYIDYFSDTIFTFPTLRAVKMHAEAGHDKIYLYEYNFVGESAPTIPYTNLKGANHCAQTAAVLDGRFNIPGSDESDLSEDYLKMKSVLRKIWISFITSGNPSSSDTSIPVWPNAHADGSPFMSLGRTVSLGGGALLESRMRFWHDIYERHYRAPIPPPTPPHTEL